MPPAARCPPTPRARRALPRPHPTALSRCADADPAPRARPVLVPPSFEDARAFFATPVPARGKAYGRHARAIMEELEQEQVALRSARRKYELPEINSGDVVKVTYYESLTDKTESSFQGIVLGLFNKGVMQSVELRNVVDGVPLVRPPPNPQPAPAFLGVERAGQREAGEGTEGARVSGRWGKRTALLRRCLLLARHKLAPQGNGVLRRSFGFHCCRRW